MSERTMFSVSLPVPRLPEPTPWVDRFADPIARHSHTQVVVGSYFETRAK